MEDTLLFRWLVGLKLDAAISDATSSSENRETLNGVIAEALCAAPRRRTQSGGELPHAHIGDRPESNAVAQSQGGQTKLACRGHLLTKNRTRMMVGAQVTHTHGNTETHAELRPLERRSGRHCFAIGAGRSYDNQFFVKECHRLQVDTHVAARKTGSAVGPKLIPLPGEQISQRKRVEWMSVLAAAAYNLVRMRNLLAALV